MDLHGNLPGRLCGIAAAPGSRATRGRRQSAKVRPMIRAAAFVLVTGFFAAVSRKSLLKPRSHGFPRFFAWEAILGLVLLNAAPWFKAPFSPLQLASWVLLFASIFLAIHGAWLLRAVGKPDGNRPGEELLAFEKTSSLVAVGAYRYIRHPLYLFLLALAWGVFLKRPSPAGAFLAAAASFFLLLTARCDESECLKQFGDAYRSYMLRTKRFIPFVF